MSTTKSPENRFIEKIVAVYLRLLEESGSEQEARAKVERFTRGALRKLGFKGSSEKLELRTAQLLRIAGDRAKAKVENKHFLTEIRLGEGASSYAVGFLPGVRIPNTPENHESWKAFLETLAPKTRIGPDPETGEIGILFRDGSWLGDLMLADDVRSFNVPEQITRIRGALIARGARVVNKAFTHKLHVDGDLEIHHDLLRQPPPAVKFDGSLRLNGVRSLLDAPFPPDRLTAWGLTPGAGLFIRNDGFTLQESAGAGREAPFLRGENVLANYVWLGERWDKVKQQRLPEATFEATHSKLNRLCLELSLGTGFIAKSISRVPDNIDRIALYLDMVLDAADDSTSAKNKDAEGTRGLLDALYQLRALFGVKRIDADAVHAALDAITDEQRDSAVKMALRPRRKIGEKPVQADLDKVLDILDREPSPLETLGDALGTATALRLAFRSDAMRSNLEQALASLKRAFDQTVEGMRSPDLPDFPAFVEAPLSALETIRTIASAKGGRLNSAPLEAELRDMRKTSPKEMVRRISNVPYSEETPAFKADKALLRTLFELAATALAKQPFDAPTMLSMLVPQLKSSAAIRLRDALAAMLRDAPVEDPMTSALVTRMQGTNPEQLLKIVRNWLRMHLEVVRKFNELGTLDYGTAREVAREEKTIAMIGLPPEARREINTRMNRMCLLTGLGRGFLETGDAALEDNLRKLAHYVSVALAITPGSPIPLLDDKERAALEAVREALLNLAQCLDTGDSSCADESLRVLSDKVLQVVAAILAKPRHPADTIKLARDIEYLDGLRDSRTTLDHVFGDAGRFLLFANSCLASKEMKGAVSGHIKPLYLALSKMGGAARGVTANNLLRKTCDPDEFLNRAAISRHKAEADTIAETLAKLCSTSIADMTSDLRKASSDNSQGALKNDREFLGRVLALDGAAFGSLQLDQRQAAHLLLIMLESHLSGWVKDRSESGRFAGKTPRQIVTLALERGKWELNILRAYNKLTTKPR